MVAHHQLDPWGRRSGWGSNDAGDAGDAGQERLTTSGHGRLGAHPPE